MRILLTTYGLNWRGGLELFVSDLARKLVTWGHEPVVFSPVVSTLVKDLRGWAVPVTQNLAAMTVPPDVILGNDDVSTMMALHHFRDAPAIFICHGTHVLAPRFPRIRRYIAVDETCRSHLTSECGINPDAIEVVFSSVDLDRFPSRPPLPARPRRAAMFGHDFRPSAPMSAVRAACSEAGIDLDVIGAGAGTVAEAPEQILPRYDLVFARARSALEAMATGAAVILMGPSRMGSLVTTADVDRCRVLNFGRRLLTIPTNVDSVRREIARYDPADAAEVSLRIRATASLDLAARQIVDMAEETVEEQRTAGRDVDAEYAATALYLHDVLVVMKRATVFQRLRARIARWPLVGDLAVRAATSVFRALAR